MRIPHHLSLARSGRWHFRRRVPTDLIERLGQRFIKRSLATSSLPIARLRALALCVQCDDLFASLRGQCVARRQKGNVQVDDAARFDYSIKLDGLELTAHDEADHLRLKNLLSEHPEILSRANPSPVAPVKVQAGSGLTAGECARKWLLSIKDSTKPKTYTQKRKAIEEFTTRHADIPLAQIDRTHVSEWVEVLRRSGLSTPTILNKTSYLTGFFDWAIRAGHYPRGDNPASGQVQYRAREKRDRKKKYGFKAFSADEIQKLYAPANLLMLSPAARWGVLLQLYTGARVTEVGQLRIVDIAEDDGIVCLHINDEGPGQSVKNDASRRVVPLHPDLVAMGFVDYVSAMKELGQERLFPRLKLDSRNGQGNAFSTAFTRHLDRVGVERRDRKVGTHALRKTVIHMMQTAGVTSEFRSQYTGHELSDEHHSTYSRKYSRASLRPRSTLRSISSWTSRASLM